MGVSLPSSDVNNLRDLDTNDLLIELIKEMKVMNLHLAIITNNYITTESVETEDGD